MLPSSGARLATVCSHLSRSAGKVGIKMKFEGNLYKSYIKQIRLRGSEKSIEACKKRRMWG